MRLRWKVGPGEYVEAYEHRLDAGLPEGRTVVRGQKPRDPNRFNGFRSRSAMEKSERARARHAARQEFVKEIVRLYREGKTTIEVGAIVGRDPSAVTRALRQAGLEGRTPQAYWPALDEDEVVRLYVDEDVPPDTIATRLGVGSARVRRVLQARRVMRRPGRPSRPGTRSYAAEFEAARPFVLRRARDRCELGLDGVCEHRAAHVHHRKMRSQGGGNELWNLIAVCAKCHHEIHRSPARSYAAGWTVRSHEEAQLVPVQTRRGLVYLKASEELAHVSSHPRQ